MLEFLDKDVFVESATNGCIRRCWWCPHCSSIQLLEGNVTEGEHIACHYYAGGRDDGFSGVGNILCSLVGLKLFCGKCNACIGWDTGVQYMEIASAVKSQESYVG